MTTGGIWTAAPAFSHTGSIVGRGRMTPPGGDLGRRDAAIGLATALALGPKRLFAQDVSPIRVGGTLSLTGPLAASATAHRLGGEIFLSGMNGQGGFLGRPVEWVLLDDQSKPEIARALYERLVSSDKVDLLIGPYATSAILSAMTVAARYGKVLVHDSLGTPALATYERQFPAYALGQHPEATGPTALLDTLAATGAAPRSVTVLSSKFPSALFIAQGMQAVAAARGVSVPLALNYEAGTRDFGSIAARVRAADADLLWVGALGNDGALLLESLARIEAKPRSHFYLYPSIGSLQGAPGSNGAIVPTLFEDLSPLNLAPGAAAFAAEYRQKAKAAGLAYVEPDGQAGEAFAAWQVLTSGVAATGSLDDAQIAAWLRANSVNTIIGRLSFAGTGNYGPDLQRLKQLQNGSWRIIWPDNQSTPTAVR